MHKLLMQGCLALMLLGSLALFPGASSAQTSEGVQIVGEWVIEVRNADGSLAERRAFRNAFVGSEYLSFLLAGEAELAGWTIAFTSPGGTPNCFFAVASGFACSGQATVTSAEGASPPDRFLSLSVSRVAELSSGPWSLTRVETTLGITCLPDAPSSCSTTTNKAFTRKTLEAPITIVDGQTVDVEVIIRFQ